MPALAAWLGGLPPGAESKSALSAPGLPYSSQTLIPSAGSSRQMVVFQARLFRGTPAPAPPTLEHATSGTALNRSSSPRQTTVAGIPSSCPEYLPPRGSPPHPMYSFLILSSSSCIRACAFLLPASSAELRCSAQLQTSRSNPVLIDLFYLFRAFFAPLQAAGGCVCPYSQNRWVCIFVCV